MAYNNMNILVVDDEKEIADLIGIYLQNEGYNVITCGRAAGVMDIVERENISLAILDVMLPDGDGMELLREIRREHYFPVIMLTTCQNTASPLHTLQRGRRSGRGPFGADDPRTHDRQGYPQSQAQRKRAGTDAYGVFHPALSV